MNKEETKKKYCRKRDRENEEHNCHYPHKYCEHYCDVICTPLKPLSDEEIDNVLCKHTGWCSTLKKGGVLYNKIIEAIAEINYKNQVSLPVDNTVSETEADYFEKYQFEAKLNSQKEIEISKQDKEIISLNHEAKQRERRYTELLERSVNQNEKISKLTAELEATKKECDFFATASNKRELEVVTLSEQVTSLTSQLSLYKQEDEKKKVFTKSIIDLFEGLKDAYENYDGKLTVNKDSIDSINEILNTLKQE